MRAKLETSCLSPWYVVFRWLQCQSVGGVRPLCPSFRSSNLDTRLSSDPATHGLCKRKAILEAVVQRRRRNADHIRLAPVADHAVTLQVFKQGTALFAPGLYADGKLRPAP